MERQNSKAQLIDNKGNVLIESEGSYPEMLEVFNNLSDEDTQEKEEPEQHEEPLTNSDFHDARVKVLEDITDEYNDTLDKGTITTDVNVLYGSNLLINRVIVEPKDYPFLSLIMQMLIKQIIHD